MAKTNNTFKIPSYHCRVCDAPAKHSFFGVTACRACKMFFRRNASIKQGVLTCDFGGNCEVNVNSRHVCPACRLAKCFQRGMTTDKFHRSKIVHSKQPALMSIEYKPERLPALNLLQSDQSQLTGDQWTLLTNLFHCYNESEMVPLIHFLMSTQYDQRYIHTMDAELVDKFLTVGHKSVEKYICSNADLRRLSCEDRSLLLHGITDNICCIISTFVLLFGNIYNLSWFLKIMITRFGKRTIDFHIWARKFIDPDIVVAKLSISLFAFSESNYRYYPKGLKASVDPLYVFAIQSKYAELTWKYLVYKYGHENSVRRYLNLILWLTSTSSLAVHAQMLTNYVDILDSVADDIELQLILDEVEEMTDSNK